MAINLSRLNPKQREAVLHDEGPLLILAGAGSGKTNTMAHRIAHLIADRGVSPASILGLSFTNKAAAELKERVRRMMKQSRTISADLKKGDPIRGITISTFHALCVRLLRANAERLGFSKDFSILDSSDQLDILRTCLRRVKIDDRKFDLGWILFQFSQVKNRFMNVEEAEEVFFERMKTGKMHGDYAAAASATYRSYLEEVRLRNAMDFDDLIYHAVKLLESNPDLSRGYSRKFAHILVDEYQDTNPAQSRLLSLLTSEHDNLCVVGDDDQSIYAWRGADPEHILGFRDRYPAAKVITLDQNYRSTSTILDAANAVIVENRHRFPKKLWSDRGDGEPITEVIVDEDRAEAETVAERINHLALSRHEGQVSRLRPWKDFAILYRSNSQSRIFEEALRLNGIPYKLVGALSFLDRKEVKDLLSYWRILANDKDDASARRVLNWPPRGIGKSAMEAINQHAVQNQMSVMDTLQQAHALSTPIAPKSKTGIDLFLNLTQQLKTDLLATSPDPAALAAWAKRSIDRIGFKNALLDEHKDDPQQALRKYENVDELCNAIGQLDLQELQTELHPPQQGLSADPLTATEILQAFLSKLLVEARDEDDKKEKDEDQVTLLTVHSAKGLEFPVVFLVGCEDGYLPHQRTIDEGADLSEERRLCYVGITRARDHLYLSRAKTRVRYGKALPRNRSRFLETIPETLILREDLSKDPDLSRTEAREKHENMVKDFMSQIRSKLGAKPEPNA